MEPVIQGKKISIKHYLNTKLKPTLDGEGRELFPVYTQVVFKGKATRFRTDQAFTPNDISDIGFDASNPDRYFTFFVLPIKYQEKIEFEGFLASNKLIQLLTNRIVAIIKYEVDSPYISEFTLKGLAKRLKEYFFPLEDLIDDLASGPVISFVGEYIPYNHLKGLFEKRANLIEIYEEVLKYVPQEKIPTPVQGLVGLFWLAKNLGKISVFDFLTENSKKLTEAVTNTSFLSESMPFPTVKKMVVGYIYRHTT